MNFRLKICIIIFILSCLTVLECINLYQKHHRITLVKPCGRIACSMAAQIVNKTNQLGINSHDEYSFYTANFKIEEKTLPAPEKSVKNIIWLGGSFPFFLDNLTDYDIILTTTPQLQQFLKKQGFESHYLPMAIEDKTLQPKNPHIIALIGNLPFIEDILRKKNILYRKYSLKQTEKIMSDMPLFKAAFVENTFFQQNSLDLDPLILHIASQKIPLAAYWAWPVIEEAVNLFDDRINFYMDESDAERLIEELEAPQLSIDIRERIQRAKKLVDQEFSISAIAKKLKAILENKKDTLFYDIDNSLIIDIPVAVGHTGSGDYWLAQDLIYGLKKYPYQSEISFYNSPRHYPTETTIFVRGFLPFIYNDVNYFNPSKFNIIYVAYAQFGDNNEIEYVEDFDTYVNNLIKVSQSPEVNALAIASKSLTNTLNTKGITAYYIPQFTNIQRFYPDYHEELKSEVFFVGKNVFYRTAAPTLLEAGLPITIYGPNWGGKAKGEFLDNRELRKYYSSAKIVLNDTREGMKKYGFVSNRIYDATACGSLVISDYMPEIEETYGDTVPMYKNEEELIELVKYYLAPENESERLDKANRAREITLQNFTADIAAEKFNEIIEKVRKGKNNE